jgi:hypothetical protein
MSGNAREKKAQKECDQFNAANPVGTNVLYWKGVREDGPSGVAPTRSEAQVLGGHTSVVWVKGEGGCIALSHVEVAPSYLRLTNGGDCHGRATTVYVVRAGECTTQWSACRACGGWAEKWAIIDKSCCCLRGGWSLCSQIAPGASGRPPEGVKVVTVKVTDLGCLRYVQGVTSLKVDDPTGLFQTFCGMKPCSRIGE